MATDVEEEKVGDNIARPNMALVGNSEQQANETKIIHLEFGPEHRFNVTYTGIWNGYLVKKALRAIELQYKYNKQNVVRGEIKEATNVSTK